MDLKNDFQTYWDLMQPDETFANRRDAAEEEWNNHPEKHYAIIRWLRKHGAYSDRNPFFFIQDFKMKKSVRHASEPVFLNGDEPGDLVQVRYNGIYKICTRDTMQQFGLEYVRDWKTIDD